MKTFKALARGFVNGSIVEVGQIFEYEGEHGSWMQEVKADVVQEIEVKEKPKAKVKKEQTVI